MTPEDDFSPAPAPVATEQPPAPPPGPSFQDIKRRIRELLSIPDRERTDAEWDELVELEIQTAPGNRIESPQKFAPGAPQKPKGNFQKQKPHGGPGKPNKHHRRPHPPKP